MWRKGNPQALLLGMETSEATVANSMEVSQKIKILLLYDPAISCLGVYPKKCKTLISKDMHPSVQSNIIYISQDMETPTVSIKMNG